MVPCLVVFVLETGSARGRHWAARGLLGRADEDQLLAPVNDDVEVGWTPPGMAVGVPVTVEVTDGVGVGVTMVVGAANSTSFAMRKPWTRTPATNTRSPRWMPCAVVKVDCVAVMVGVGTGSRVGVAVGVAARVGVAVGVAATV